MPYDKKNPRHAYAKAFALLAAVLCAVAIVCVMRNPSARNADSVATQPPAAGVVQTSDDATEDQGDSSVVDDDANTMVASKMADIEAPQPYEYVDEVDSGETGDDAATETSDDDERLTIPEGANYVPDEVLVSVSPDATVEGVNALLAQTDSVVPREVSADEIADGYITVEVAEGASVEDAMNDLDDSEQTEGAQPNFIYYAMLGDERDLRARLAASAIPQPMLRAAAGEDTESSDATADDVSAAEETAGKNTQSSTAMDGETEAAEEPSAVEPTGAEGDAVAPEDAAQEGGGEASETGEAVEPSEGAPTEETASPDAADQQLEPEDGETDGAIEAQGSDDATAQDEEQLGMHALAEELKSNDALLSKQWALASMHVYEAWALARCEHTVGVAVIDQGQDPTHEDLVGNVVATYDAVTESESISFTNYHGTAVSGIVSAVADNEIGAAGVSYNADLVLVNAMLPDLSTRTKYLVSAIDYAISKADAHNIRVINLSIGGAVKTPVDQMIDKTLEKAINRAYEKGIVTVAAAGNAGSSYGDGSLAEAPFYEYPGDFENVVSVINLRQSGSSVARADGSNYNVDGQTSKNISAPGTSILSAYDDNRYSTQSGTSFAAPQVSGVLALEFAANPQLSAKEAVDILYGSAADIGKSGWDAEYGWGEVNAFEAVKAANDTKEGEPVEELPDISDFEVPVPTIKGATRIPVGATTTYTVTNGSIKIKSGGSYASLKGKTLTGLKKGTVTLAVLDKNGHERSIHTVSVYNTVGTWTLASKLDVAYVIDIQKGSIENKGNAIIYRSNGKNNQVWLLQRQIDGSFVIRSGKSGKVLDVSGGSKSSGANVCQYALGTKAWQRWTMQVASDNSIVFVNKNSGKVLEVGSNYAGNGKNVRQATKTGTLRQRWVLRSVKADIGSVWDGVYRISSSINRNYVIEVQRKSKTNSANVDLYRWNGGANQRWKIEYLGKGVYKITNVNSLKSLDVKGAKLGYSVNIDQYDWKNTGNQRWNLNKNASGSYEIERAGTSWVVDAKGAKAQNGTNVHQYKRKYNNAQKWFLTQL